MAKLSETYKSKTSNGETTGGGLSAPVSLGSGKLSETYTSGMNTYQAPKVEFKKVPTLEASTNLSALTTPTPTLYKSEEDKGFWNGIKNSIFNLSPSNAVKQATKQKEQQAVRNADLSVFDAHDNSAVVYTDKNGNGITKNKINLWLQPEYEYSKNEKKQIKELIDKATDVRNYQKYFGNMDVTEAAKIQQDISRLEQRTKGALGYGVAEAIPGFKATENIAAKTIDAVNGNTNVSDMLKADQEATQNTSAYKVGRAGSKMLQYYGLNKSGVLNPLTNKLSNVLIPKLGEALGGHVANILSDEVADVILDTLPEMTDNIMEGKTAKEVSTDVLKNLGENLAYNVGGEYLPELLKVFKTKEVEEAVEEATEQAAKNTGVINQTHDFAKNVSEATEIPKVADEVTTVAKNTAPEVHTIAKAVPSNKILSDGTFKETVTGLGRSFDGKVKYLRDSNNEYAKSFKEALNNFANKPTKSTYEKAIKALDNYADNAGTAMKKNYNGEWYEKTFDGKKIRSSLEELGDKYNLKKVEKNLVMPEDAGLNDEISELIAPVEIKADAPKIPDGAELPTLEPEVGPVSQFWKGGTMETVTDPDTYKNAYEPMTDVNRYVQKPDEYAQMVSDARLLTNGAVDAKKIDEWRKALSLAEDISKEDMATAMDIKAYYEANNMLKESADFMSRIRPHITNDAQVLQYLGSLKKNTIDGSIENALGKLRKDVDKHFGKKGFSDAINNFTRQVEDTIKSGNADDVEKLFNKNLSDFGYGKEAKTRLKNTTVKGEKKVLDIIKKAKAGTPEDEIAKEVSSAIRKLNGVADISIEDELEIKRLLTEASQYSKDSRQFKELRSQAAKIIDDKTPVTFANKFKTYLYDNMLGNLKTGLTRNAGGNTISNTLEGLQKPLKVGIDKLTSLKTGQRNYILSPKVSAAYAEGFKKGLKDQTLDILHKTPTTRSGEDSFADAIAAVKRTYKGKNIISKGLNAYDSTVKNVMSFGDRPYYEGAFAATKAELNEIAEKYGKDAISQVGVPKEALDSLDDTIEFLARERALEAVFQKGSLSAEAFTEMKEALGKMSKDFIGVDVLSQFSMPFIQVPANMMSRLADYLPGVGTIKNVANSVLESKYGGGFNQRRFVDATSRNITGLGLFGGGIALAENAKNGGFGITGGLSDDADKAAAQRNAGEQEYALQLPSGRQIDISDLPTLGPMAKASSSFYEALNKNKGDLTQGLTDATAQALSSVMETSTLQGLNRLFGTNEYGNGGGFGENVKNVIGAGLGQMLPSLERQATQVIDPYKRDLGEYGTPAYYLNNLINATPLRMSLLNPKLDNEGNIIEQNQGRSTGMKVLENMILPWTITDPEYTKLGEAANKIYEKSSDHTTKAYPTVPSRSKAKEWLGDRYDDQTYYELKEMAGRYNTRIGGYIVGTRFFKDLSPDDQADVMSSINTAITALVRERAERGYENKNTLAKKYKEGGLDAVMEYLQSKYSKDIPTLK